MRKEMINKETLKIRKECERKLKEKDINTESNQK